MRKILNLVVLLPLAVVLIVLSVANRQPVQFSLDPLNTNEPILALTLPFFVFLFVSLLFGAIVGGLITWFSQGRNRKELRKRTDEVNKLIREKERVAEQALAGKKEIAPGLPVASLPDKAA